MIHTPYKDALWEKISHSYYHLLAAPNTWHLELPKIIFQSSQFLVAVVERKKAREGKINLNLLLLYS